MTETQSERCGHDFSHSADVLAGVSVLVRNTGRCPACLYRCWRGARQPTVGQRT